MKGTQGQLAGLGSRIGPRPPGGTVAIVPPAPARGQRRGAFTLIELLVVVGIISLLLSLLLPGLSHAMEMGRRGVCMNNLRVMAVAAHTYAARFDDQFPIAYYNEVGPLAATSYCWDFKTTTDASGTRVEPGILWQGDAAADIQQCPSFKGSANWQADPHTGYNYNTSYIGHGQGESVQAPARIDRVKAPQSCALFGDGQFATGANKFMRAPWKNPGDASFSGRYAGTQGFRHAGTTCVAFCDGSTLPLTACFKDTYTSDIKKIALNTGFLSSDNGLYDLQ